MHALTLLLITLFFGRWAALDSAGDARRHSGGRRISYERVADVPQRADARRRATSRCCSPRFVLTVLVDLTVAIEVGMVLAAFLFMRRMAEVTNVSVVTRELDDDAARRRRRRSERGRRRRTVPRGVEVLRDQRPVLLRRRRDVQGHPRPDRQEAEGADHSAARRAGDRFDGTARAPRACPQLQARRHAAPARRRPRATDVRAGALRHASRDRRGNLFGNLDDALDRLAHISGLPASSHPREAVPTVAREPLSERRQDRLTEPRSSADNVLSGARAMLPCWNHYPDKAINDRQQPRQKAQYSD